METLSLDFNRADREGRVRIGPEAVARQRAVVERLAVGDRVLVTDGHDTCEGMIERGSVPEYGGKIGYAVRLDDATWQDGSGAAS